jgi:PleD family two-component response regulator
MAMKSAKSLKASSQTKDIPVIFISALHEVFDKVKAFEVGGVDYITNHFKWKRFWLVSKIN